MKTAIFDGGFIGSTVADCLLKDGDELRIFERPSVEPYRQFLEGDRAYGRSDTVNTQFLGQKIEMVTRFLMIFNLRIIIWRSIPLLMT
jgi:nucleoside-diphosphate-sugar epimerase